MGEGYQKVSLSSRDGVICVCFENYELASGTAWKIPLYGHLLPTTLLTTSSKVRSFSIHCGRIEQFSVPTGDLGVRYN